MWTKWHPDPIQFHSESLYVISLPFPYYTSDLPKYLQASVLHLSCAPQVRLSFPVLLHTVPSAPTQSPFPVLLYSARSSTEWFWSQPTVRLEWHWHMPTGAPFRKIPTFWRKLVIMRRFLPTGVRVEQIHLELESVHCSFLVFPVPQLFWSQDEPSIVTWEVFFLQQEQRCVWS